MLQEGMKIYTFPETDVMAYASLIRDQGFKPEIYSNYIRVGAKRKRLINKEKFSKAIRKTRKAMGINRKQLADLIGCTEDTVFSWELGKTAPNEKNMNKIIEIMGDII